MSLISGFESHERDFPGPGIDQTWRQGTRWNSVVWKMIRARSPSGNAAPLDPALKGLAERLRGSHGAPVGIQLTARPVETWSDLPSQEDQVGCPGSASASRQPGGPARILSQESGRRVRVESEVERDRRHLPGDAITK
jgi:hypothetical protein